MAFLWDYDEKKLKKTATGRRFILERMINYGVYLHDKIKPKRRDIKRHWKTLTIDSDRKHYLRFLLWGK